MPSDKDFDRIQRDPVLKENTTNPLKFEFTYLDRLHVLYNSKRTLKNGNTIQRRLLEPLQKIRSDPQLPIRISLSAAPTTYQKHGPISLK